MLPLYKVAYMRLENNFRWYYIEKLPKLNYVDMSVFLNR